MESFFTSLEQAVVQRNWHAALVLALVMPDLCGKAAYGGNTGERYKRWFDQYMASKYIIPIGPDQTPHTFMTSQDCYLLRCALLHQGSDVIRGDIEGALSRFVFSSPPLGGMIHRNRSDSNSGGKLQLQVDIFAREMLEACRTWWSSVPESDKPDIEGNLLKVHDPTRGFSF